MHNSYFFSIFVFIIFTLIFFLVIGENVNITRCNGHGKCFDGNGKYQYKGRGCEDEDINILLSRIDWLAKNADNKPLYYTAYIISFAIILAILVIFYATQKYILNAWEIMLVIFSTFIVTFSIMNLFDFHTDRYPSFYIRENIEYISNKYKIKIKEPPKPCKHTFVPNRTKVRDKLNM